MYIVTTQKEGMGLDLAHLTYLIKLITQSKAQIRSIIIQVQRF